MIIILGKGGHAKVCAEALRSHSREILFEFRTTEDQISVNDEVIIGIGDIKIRRSLFEKYRWQVLSLAHPSSVIASDYKPNLGIQIMAGAIIQPGCKIDENVLINTRASVDHDCIIGSHVHIAPGAILCGGVTVRDGAFIGAGAIIPEGRNVPADAFVPAGTVFK